MFNSMIDQYAKNVKSVYSFIPGAEIRSKLEAVTDTQAAFSKAVIAAGLEFGKLTMDEITKMKFPKTSK